MTDELKTQLGRMGDIRSTLVERGWFGQPGAYVLVDGQFGSTGKGVLAGLVAECLGDRIDVVTTNAGPNSGHTAYHKGYKIVTQQLPIASVVAAREGLNVMTHLNGGSIIDIDRLNCEAVEHAVEYSVHPHAALIGDEDRAITLSHIASTGKGVGPAMARKLLRDPRAVIGHEDNRSKVDRFFGSINKGGLEVLADECAVFVETAQGFSLGLNSGFYPYTTSRECTVSQAMSDARLSPRAFRKSMVALRTYPIRVGNTADGHSGGWYDDQTETSWEALGQAPELTTVTNRVRRVANFSFQQWRECVWVNQPDLVFLNFCNYMTEDELRALTARMIAEYRQVKGHNPETLLLGFGPMPTDVVLAKLGPQGQVTWDRSLSTYRTK